MEEDYVYNTVSEIIKDKIDREKFDKTFWYIYNGNSIGPNGIRGDTDGDNISTFLMGPMEKGESMLNLLLEKGFESPQIYHIIDKVENVGGVGIFAIIYDPKKDDHFYVSLKTRTEKEK